MKVWHNAVESGLTWLQHILLDAQLEHVSWYMMLMLLPLLMRTLLNLMLFVGPTNVESITSA
jgi:hypothetical protein